jgi:hypothetical protein
MNNRRSGVVALCASGILALDLMCAASPATAQENEAMRDPAAVLNWNQIAARADLLAMQTNQESMLHMAYVQAAVFDAIDAIDGGYRPYVGHLRARGATNADAAVAAAAHQVLVSEYPNQTAMLDADYSAALAAIPDGPAKRRGVSVGQQAAAELLAARASDGYGAHVPYTFGSGPGVWVLPTDNPATTPATPWVAKMRPFVMRSADQFRPGPPPALHTATYTKAYQDTKIYGSKTSSVRTAAQTDTALFWGLGRPTTQYNEAVRKMVKATAMNRIQAARALALLNLIGADAFIACFDGKYTYSAWRPYTAIRAGDTDGNPDTVADPAWTPLVTTPNHPEYPANHSCVSTSFAKTIDHLLGPNRFDVTVTGAPASTEERHYTNSDEFIAEIADARVWGGVHFRFSTTAGTRIGEAVAGYDFRHALQPLHDRD